MDLRHCDAVEMTIVFSLGLKLVRTPLNVLIRGF